MGYGYMKYCNKNNFRCIVSPKNKKTIKRKFSKKRRKINKYDLKLLKYQFNNGVDVENLDTQKIIKDPNVIKLKSRQGADCDFVERRTTNGRLLVAQGW